VGHRGPPPHLTCPHRASGVGDTSPWGPDPPPMGRARARRWMRGPQTPHTAVSPRYLTSPYESVFKSSSLRAMQAHPTTFGNFKAGALRDSASLGLSLWSLFRAQISTSRARAGTRAGPQSRSAPPFRAHRLHLPRPSTWTRPSSPVTSTRSAPPLPRSGTPPVATPLLAPPSPKRLFLSVGLPLSAHPCSATPTPPQHAQPRPLPKTAPLR
jgi:hypothetical protein